MAKARVVVTRKDDRDMMAVAAEAEGVDEATLAQAVQGILKLSGEVSIHALGSLPKDGKVIDDQRTYD